MRMTDAVPGWHNSLMKAKIVAGLFIALAIAWAFAVINATGSWDAWRAWGLALLGSFWISAIGWRMHYLINRKTLRQRAALK